MKKKIMIIVCSIIALVTLISLILILNNDKKAKTYNVSFETNGGTEISTQVVNEGDKAIKPDDPEKEGYIFIQWLYEGKTYDFSAVVNSDLILKAEWIEKKENIETFVVSFNSDGGTTISNQIIEKGNKVTMPTNPTKEGYNFIEWQYNGVKYDFEKIIESDLELVAKWEQIENKNNKPTNNNNKKPVNSGTNNNNSNNKDTVITLNIPILTEAGVGMSPEVNGAQYTVTGIEFADGIEVYKSPDGTNYKLELSLNKTQLSQENNSIILESALGEQNRYKVRAYKTVNGKKVYSEYTNIINIRGPVLEVPTLTETGVGMSPEVNGAQYTVTGIEFADGIEVYKSPDGTNYKLELSLNKTQLSQENNSIILESALGEQNRYKVRAYKTVNGKKVYSEYTNIINIRGPVLDIPTLTESGKGVTPDQASITYTVVDIDVADGIEIYKSTTGSDYKLEKTLTNFQLEQNNSIETIAYVGEHNYYKVRAYKTVNGKKVYSEYSRVVEVNGPLG